MANRYEFMTPRRVEIPMGDDPLFSRIRNKAGVALIQAPDGTWSEHDYLPNSLDANADYLFGRTTRSNIPKGKGFAVSQDSHGQNLVNPEDYGWESSLRIYRGGRRYILDDTLRQELLDAVTNEEPNGYGSYISSVADTGQRVGDEVMRSGRTPEFEQSTTNSDPNHWFDTGLYTANYSESY